MFHIHINCFFFPARFGHTISRTPRAPPTCSQSVDPLHPPRPPLRRILAPPVPVPIVFPSCNADTHPYSAYTGHIVPTALQREVARCRSGESS